MDVTADWYWEGNVVDAIARFLAQEGWTIVSKADTHSKERGVDIQASRDGKTLLLEAKGYLRHAKAKDARAFVYRPVVGRLEATRNAVRQLLGRFFGDSPEALVLNLLEDETLGEVELMKIRRLLQQSKGERK